MTQTTTNPYPDVAPPPGFEADRWDDAGRDIYQLAGTVLASNDFMKCPLVSAVARQRLDGSLESLTVEVDDAGHQPLTSTQAREMAGYLIEAADMIDRWAGRSANDSRLAMVHATVLETYNALKTVPGNAGDYLKAALIALTTPGRCCDEHRR